MSAVGSAALPDWLPEPAAAAPLREPAPEGEVRLQVGADRFEETVRAIRAAGARFITIFDAAGPRRPVIAIFALRGDLVAIRCEDEERPPVSAIGAWWPAARWAELERAERGEPPAGSERGEPPAGSVRSESPERAERGEPPERAERGGPPAADGQRPARLTAPDPDRIDRGVEGLDVFSIPHGPVRSGIFEAIQFQIETGGEDVSRLQVRPFFKRRDMESRFVGLDPEAGVHLAERVAGIASCAYATAFSQAIERALRVRPPARAQCWRAVYCELERISCHLDVIAKEAESTALHVGLARFQILKERAQRLRAQLTGSRFGRGVIVPGGVRFDGRLEPGRVRAELDALEEDLRRDRRLFLGTASMTDRLIGTGRLARELIERHGGVGPLARGSGVSTDARHERPYGEYARLGLRVITERDGDAMARVGVRFGEIAESLRVLRQALDRLERVDGEMRAELAGDGAGAACGWVEAPQGELVIWAQVQDGLIERAHIASPSLRNWALFEHAFGKDVLTDFAFIEHSFGLTPAGADR